MSNKRILVIDDDETVTVLLQAILESAGYEVCIAGNAVEGNQYLWGGDKPDLIILDLMMPFLSGETVAEIFKSNESTSSIPILYASGKPEAQLQALVRETGAVGYLTKPFGPARVLEAVRGVLGDP